MSGDTIHHTDGQPIESKAELIEYLERGCKPKSNWRIGTEHEKFAYTTTDFEPLPYDGPQSVRAILEGMTRFGWAPVFENGKPVALSKADKSSITLEPGGQIELSGAPVETIHQTCREVNEHLRQVKEVAAELGISFLGVGYQPKWKLNEIPWMPKARYDIMKAHMPTVGTMGLEMMLATCTVQVNLDFDSEKSMAEMFRVSMALQPIATALFANSPFKEGRPNGFLSYRSHVWEDTDPERTGILPFIFEDGFGFERYVDYMLDVPMYFIMRDGKYVNVAGQSFRDFLKGELPGRPGEKPTLRDWEDHLTTAFPEVRLKHFLEMRGADGGPWNNLCALPALWVGLLYDDEARHAAWDMVKSWTDEEHVQLREDVPKYALKTKFRNRDLAEIAEDVLCLAHAGLKRRNELDAAGQTETHFLNPLHRIAESRMTLAEELLAAYESRWNHSVDPVFQEYAY